MVTNIHFFPNTFAIFQKRTFINVQNGKIETLLEKLFQTIEFPKEFEVFFSHEYGLDNKKGVKWAF